ncbi:MULTISPECIES: metallophosphoesterase [Microbacterium]|uniref:Metallophosphoesterase n=1 Tax=Microbacterium wangchenii TaxID=2541726 RepID=A0ABX5STT1_9MICO|nr:MULTISPECIES: metallophosphoesterase [Microbacterium]MCK6067467.1 metallophosphoesterase [Microbacterium sp. EYE_512]QBR89598.1 metallophosphoesterase [Microbacterium wangchenii]TXK16803.1 metallophosphoesterase [Microbacterium wangchenii]
MAPGPIAKTTLTALGAVGVVGASAAVWGIGIERYLFTVRYAALRVLPAGASPVRVLHLSDAHMAPWQRRKQQWIAGLADLRPDLIVNTGDNLGHAEGLAGIRAAFAPFAGIPGVFVHGSNDMQAPSPRNPLLYFSGPSKRKPAVQNLDVDALDRYLEDELGWRDLDNTAAALAVGGLRIRAFGVDDAHRDWDDLEATATALAGLGDGDLSLGVTHAPYRRVLDEFTDLGADVLLAGHTHGGQVRIPGSRKALVANCDVPLDQARGLSDWTHDGRTVPLNVSAGIGHSIYAPVRFACRPEVTLLTLLPR